MTWEQAMFESITWFCVVWHWKGFQSGDNN